MFNKNGDRHGMFVVFLVNRERFFEETMFSSDLRNLPGVVVLELVNISNNLSFVRADCSQQKEILQVTIIAEG